MFEILLKNKFKIIWNSFFKDTQPKQWRKLLGVIGSGFLFWFMLQWVQDIFQVMLQTDLLPGTVTQRIELFAGNITLIFNALFLFLFMGGVSISVHYLYTSADLALLLATPLSLAAIFSFQIIETIFVNAGIFFLIGGAILIGQGLLIDAPLVYYLIMLLVGLVYISLPTMLAIFLALFVVQLLPPRRIRELSSALTGLVGLGIWVLIQLIRISLADPAESTPPATHTPQIFEYSRAIQQFWTPGQVISNFTSYYLNPLTPFPWISTGIFIIGAAVLFYFCLDFSIRQYLKTGTITHQTLLIKHSRGHQNQINRSRRPVLTQALMGKDWRLMFRNPQLSIQLFLMLGMILFISLMLPVSKEQPILLARMDENALGYFFLLFIIVAAQNASRLIPLENKAFWLLQIAPVRMRQFLWRKFFLSFLINQALAVLILGVITIYHQLSLNLFVNLFILTLLINLSATSMGIFLGSHYPRLDWEHPKRMLTATGTLLLPALSVLYFVFLILLEFLFQNFEFNLLWDNSLMQLSLLLFGLILLECVVKLSEKKLVNIDSII
jgi:hypothetical protein